MLRWVGHAHARMDAVGRGARLWVAVGNMQVQSMLRRAFRVQRTGTQTSKGTRASARMTRPRSSSRVRVR